jgi:hypothetical protein
MSYRASPDVLLSMNPYMCSLLSPSHNLSSLISNSITKDNTCLDLTFLCCSVQYIFVNRFSNVYSSALNIDLRLVLMITRCIYSNIFFIFEHVVETTMSWYVVFHG